MLDDCLSGEDTTSGFGVVLIARGHEVGGGDARYDVGTFADIDTVVREPDGQAVLSCTGRWRFRVIEWLPEDIDEPATTSPNSPAPHPPAPYPRAPYPRALIRPLSEPPADAASTQRLLEIGTRIRALVDDSFRGRGLPTDELPRFDAADLTRVGVFGWAARLPIGAADRQALLEAADAEARCHSFDDAVSTLEARIRFGA